MTTKTVRGAFAFGTAILLAVPGVPAIAPVHHDLTLPPPMVPLGESGLSEFGYATWYGEQFEGRNTASGDKFAMARLTAAHRRFPFGSMVRVTDIATHRSIIVRINDRGPFTPKSSIDLSMAAAEQLGIRASGRARVRLDLLLNVNRDSRN